jgi:four helix bundle protein
MKHNFKELKTWKRIRTFIVDIYELTSPFPVEEKFELVSQMRRASVSASLNIIEGTGRSTNKQLANFLDIAYGSMKEVQGCLIHSHDLGYISLEQLNRFEKESIEIQKMLYAFREKIIKDTKQKENEN